ncbi:transcriptional regulator, LysR family [Faunimonas pinastri]|uniref:Transcriptional regulator, LysR family n=1 Tax=Faunimonas pinastri TaxID=1855383 RepID=A0A1H9ESK9_9HYPH|nr:LysR family transcriptional regulator [Faunimonas pinastri]SEQ28639.1 transcriptional regulator, LysR family [Faunimonas pinastri]
MNLREVDLNLLTVLAALVEQRSVSAAAYQLGLSQSAASHALRRLRRLLDDEVMVRQGGRMQPTPVALRVLETVRPALAEISAALREKGSFDPGSSRRGFTLRLSEYVSPTLLTPLCTLLRRDAPGVQLAVLPVGAPGDRPIEPGEVQLRAERGRRTLVHDTSRPLFTDRFAVVMAASHPGAATPMTLDRYVALPHLKVTAGAVGTNGIDEALERLGLRRRVVMSVPSWFEMRRVVLGTDLVAAVPKHWMADVVFARGLACHDLPLPDIVLSVELAWHPRDRGDGGIAWLCDALTRIGGSSAFPA